MLSSRTSTLPSALFDVLHECALRPMTRFSTIYRAKPHLRSNRLRLHLASRNSSTSSRRITIPPPFPITPSCPEPTCPCAPTPQMPEGLEIDHERDLNGTMAPYSQQVLILTGQRDWRSRIEEDGADNGWGMLVRGLKGLIGRGGGYADVSILRPNCLFMDPGTPPELFPFLDLLDFQGNEGAERVEQLPLRAALIRI